MKFLEKFLLEIPYLFIMKIPYAWLAAVVFWGWPPVVSGILTLIVLVGLLMGIGQRVAWENQIIREFHSGDDKPFVDHPRAAWMFRIRNLLFVLAGSAVLGWLLKGLFGLNGVQWFCLFAGVMLLYKDALLFGAGVSYIITDQGLGVRLVPGHIDYRLFFKYAEIRQAVRIQAPARLPLQWSVLAPRSNVKEGLLLYPVNPAGFSKQLEGELLLAPTDREAFLAELARHMTIADADIFTPTSR